MHVGVRFGQVEKHVGKGAVRVTRVRHAVMSFTCTDWYGVIFTAIVVAGVCAAVGNRPTDYQHAERAGASGGRHGTGGGADLPPAVDDQGTLSLVGFFGVVLGRSCRIA